MVEFLQANILLVVGGLVILLVVLSRNGFWGTGQHEGHRETNLTGGVDSGPLSTLSSEPASNGQVGKANVGQTQPHQPHNHSGCC